MKHLHDALWAFDSDYQRTYVMDIDWMSSTVELLLVMPDGRKKTSTMPVTRFAKFARDKHTTPIPVPDAPEDDDE